MAIRGVRVNAHLECVLFMNYLANLPNSISEILPGQEVGPDYLTQRLTSIAMYTSCDINIIRFISGIKYHRYLQLVLRFIRMRECAPSHDDIQQWVK